MTGRCAMCGQPVTAEQAPVRKGEDGLPLACAIIEGLGVPVVDIGSIPMIVVMTDGVEVDRCIGFDRPNAIAWRYQTVGGDVLHRDGDLLIEAVNGAITLEVRGVRG
jgi:hypothetical protein